MVKKVLVLMVLISASAIGQNSQIQTYVGKKGLYKIDYNKSWIKSDNQTEWDAVFNDAYNLVTCSYKEFDYFFSQKSLKKSIKEQYTSIGKVSNFKIHKKKLNDLEVDYFECELEYQGFEYIYQGFVYNGIGGTVEIQFGVQKEGITQYQKLIDEFCLGFGLVIE